MAKSKNTLTLPRTTYPVHRFAGEVLRRKAPRTLTARQHAHSVSIHAICIPNLATLWSVNLIVDFTINSS